MQKKTIAQAKRKFKDKKRTAFVHFCESLNRNSNSKYIWGKVNQFSSRKIKQRVNIEDNMKLELLNELAVCDILPEFDFVDSASPVNVEHFSMSEMLNSLSNKKLSAPGLDDVTYLMIKKLPVHARQTLLNIYNYCLETGSIPKEWKQYNIIPILKAGKKADNINNLRPIILSSCFVKTLEIMIKNRIEWELENKKFFSHWQTGFRKGMGITNNVAALTSHIYHAFDMNESVVAVFLDIKSAYNHVNIFKLYHILMSTNIPSLLGKLILSILKDREMYIRKNNGTLAGPKITSKGIPQGSPLSTILFNIYIRDLFENKDGIIMSGYADDLVVFIKGNNYNEMVQRMNNYIAALEEKLEDKELSLSPQKCEAMWFVKGRRREQPIKIKIGGQEIDYRENVQYLGISLQLNLKWDLHINSMVNKALTALNTLKIFTRIFWLQNLYQKSSL